MRKYLTRRRKKNKKLKKTRKYFGGNDFEEDVPSYIKEVLDSSNNKTPSSPSILDQEEKDQEEKEKEKPEYGSKAAYEPTEEVIEIKKKLINLREQRKEIDEKILELDIILLMDEDDESLLENKRKLEKKFTDLTRVIEKYENELKEIKNAEPGITEKLEKAKEKNVNSIVNKVSNIENIEKVQSLRDTLKEAKELLEKQRKEISEMDPFADASFGKFDEIFNY